MALPILEKTWQFALNLQNTMDGNGTNDLRKIFLRMKNAMLAMGLSPWTVVGSSNASSANMTGTDLLSIPSDIVFGQAIIGGGPAVNPYSWIVLRQPGLNGGTQVCFGFPVGFGNGGINDGLEANFISMAFSPTAGFTGGSTTARPTASDEILMGQDSSEGTYWISESGFPPTRQYVVHVMQSTDGACTRIIGCHDGIMSCFISLEALGNSISGWNNPVIETLASINNSSNSTNLMDQAMWYNTFRPIDSASGHGFWAKGNIANPLQLKIGTEWHHNSEPMIADNYINEISNEYPLTPIGIHNVDLSGYTASIGERGRYGHLFDIWMSVPLLTSGDNIPSGGSKQFVVVGDFVLPWDGVSTMLFG
jgi:hypothetical protein